MFIVPITLFSCASRGEVVARVDDEPRVDHGVDARGLDDPPQQRVLCTDLDVLGALELAARVFGRDADDRLDLGVLLERPRDAVAPVGLDAGDEDALRRAHPNHTDFRSPIISNRFSWIRARTSCATVCTSALSSCIPSSSNRIGSRKRILNLAGR